MSIKELIEENYAGHVEGGPLFADGFDDAIIGICPNTLRTIYSRTKCAEILMQQENIDMMEALDYLEYNTFNTYVGEYTPIFMEDFDWNE